MIAFNKYNIFTTPTLKKIYIEGWLVFIIYNIKTLYKYIEKYIKNHRMTIDGHIHLFDWNTYNIFDEYKPLKSFDTFVGFMGIDFDKIDKYSYEN